MLRTFLDETGVHDDAEVAVGGYISRPKIWRDWTKDWNVRKRRVPDGRRSIKVFHSTDCANYRGEFEGWTKEERDPYVAQLLPVIPAHELAGIVIGVNLVALAQAFKGHLELDEMFGTPFTACFQWAISIIMEIATERGGVEEGATEILYLLRRGNLLPLGAGPSTVTSPDPYTRAFMNTFLSGAPNPTGRGQWTRLECWT